MEEKQKQFIPENEEDGEIALNGTSQPNKNDLVKNGLKYFDEVHTGKILDELGLRRLCCRRMMISHIDFIDQI
jgi:DNA-directed RNA polymerase subunit N (RpoN/RPB10)